MSRPDAARLIGEHLHDLPAADGKPRRLLMFSKAAQSPDMRDQITRRALDVGECIVHLLETNGYRITHDGDPKPTEADDGYMVHDVHCAHCGERVVQLGHLDRDPNRPGRWHSQIHRSTMDTLGLTHSCGS